MAFRQWNVIVTSNEGEKFIKRYKIVNLAMWQKVTSQLKIISYQKYPFPNLEQTLQYKVTLGKL